mmetsp:Transcript_10127/g.15082  ORF Transcript_10127/g.15082 Transcript_10127/m.15082 type:complete len:263 (+) Transcript_10127:109-897(+)|eukprot:CAMPEP_0196811856 /NCGR_PEP_ID=MMETSP1362-20130617/20097_1 /TAXON_ID=163516 /ORGANISM="Leptocylindrus danicus, Strain CCMP1856" /LENGTH=262 /DNA_ID=CAMNT_0042187247 /DNA_START=86 /DNA_END=874 /DNA_ORIENTATION=-
MTRPKIILLGDSITQLSFSSDHGFGAAICDAYQRRADVLNRGYSGYNTEWILKLLETKKADVFANDPKNVVLMTVFLGANDASSSAFNPRQHVPLPKYKENLKQIVSVIRHECGDAVKIIIIGPPPIHHEARLRYQVERYGEKATGKLERTCGLAGDYSNAAREAADEINVPFLNLWKDMLEEENWQSFLSDGLHLSGEGNKFVGEKLLEFISMHFPSLSVSGCKITGHYGTSGSKCEDLLQMGPWHDEINHRDVGKAFDQM